MSHRRRDDEHEDAMVAAKQTAKPNSDRLTTAQAAEYLGVSPYTLEGWRSRGRADSPPYIKLGGRVFYRQAALDRWIEKNTVSH